MFNGYRYIEKNGKYFAPDSLIDAQEVWDYVNLHKNDYPEIKVCADDFITVLSSDGRIIFPKEWSLMELKFAYQNNYEMFDTITFLEELRLREIDTIYGAPSNANEAIQQIERI